MLKSADGDGSPLAVDEGVELLRRGEPELDVTALGALDHFGGAVLQDQRPLGAVFDREADFDTLILDQLGGDGIQAEEVGDGTQDGIKVTAGEYGSIFHG